MGRTEESGFDDVDFCQRVATYLAGQLTGEELQQFNRELLEEPVKRSAFVQLSVMHAALYREGASLRSAQAAANQNAAESTWDDAAAQEALAQAVPADLNNSALILPALRDARKSIDADKPIPGPQAPASESAARWSSPRFRKIGSIAAAILLVSGLAWLVWPGSAPATITASVGGEKVFRAGKSLAEKQTVKINNTAIEITFSSGATALIKGPAQFTVIDQNAVQIDFGSLYAKVPTPAHGFRVDAPGLSVTDLGTEFGVCTVDGNGAEVHVYKGLVEARPLDDHAKAISDPVRVTAGHAMTHSANAPQAGLAAVEFNSTFDQNISTVKVHVPLHGTGAGLVRGALDPAWQILSTPNSYTWRPGPASVIFSPRGDFAGDTDDAKWISLHANLEDSDPGEYVYHTTVDFTGFDPATADVKANILADDNISQIRVNGVKVALPTDLPVRLHEKKKFIFSFADIHWLQGVNQVDIVVVNLPSGVIPNNTSLKVDWLAEAKPISSR